MFQPQVPRRLRALAAAGLGLVLVVVAASAAIRLSDGELGGWLPLVRGVHRVSASAATLVIFAAAWLAWRAGRRALALGVALLTVALSVLGAATGISPPPAAQAGNLLGGLALAALLASLLSAEKALSRRERALGALLAAQLALGAWLSIFAEELWSVALLAHATLGIALAGTAAWLALFHRKPLVFLLAAAVPVAGFATALLGAPLAASFAHACAAALLVALAGWTRGRFA